MKDNQCDHCQKIIKALEGGVNTEIENKRVLLCGPCWNKYIAECIGASFETVELKPITLHDCAGKKHTFHFFTHLTPPIVSIEAREIVKGERIGYQFTVMGPQEYSQADLILDLYEKIKRGLSKKYLKKYRTGTGIKDSEVVGRIEWDAEYGGEIPVLVIDGRHIPWTEFGRMLMSFEGWQFRLEIVDRTENI